VQSKLLVVQKTFGSDQIIGYLVMAVDLPMRPRCHSDGMEAMVSEKLLQSNPAQDPGWGRAKVRMGLLFDTSCRHCLAVMFDKGLSTTIEVIKCKNCLFHVTLRVKINVISLTAYASCVSMSPSGDRGPPRGGVALLLCLSFFASSRTRSVRILFCHTPGRLGGSGILIPPPQLSTDRPDGDRRP
jgi:hypothetical protein